jgi:hypothetical protein
LPAPKPRRLKTQAKDENFLRNILSIWFCYHNYCAPSESGTTPAQSAGAICDRWPIAKLVGLALGIHDEAPQPDAVIETSSDEAAARPDVPMLLATRILDGDLLGKLPKSRSDRIRRILEYAYGLAVDDEMSIVSDVDIEPDNEQLIALAPEVGCGGRAVKVYKFGNDMLSLSEISARTGRPIAFFKYHLKKGVEPEQAAVSRYDKLINAEFDRLTVKFVDDLPGKHRRAWCQCRCGAEKWVLIKHLKDNRITSCGCSRLETLSHGSAPSHVELFGERLSIGQLAVMANRSPVAIWARMCRGMTPEEAAFDRKETHSS